MPQTFGWCYITHGEKWLLLDSSRCLKCGGGDFKASVPHISVLAAKLGERSSLTLLRKDWKTSRPSATRDQEGAAKGRRELQSWPHVCAYLHCQPNQVKQTLGLGERGGVGSSSLCPTLRSSPWILHPIGHLLKLPCFRPFCLGLLFVARSHLIGTLALSLVIPGTLAPPPVCWFLV